MKVTLNKQRLPVDAIAHKLGDDLLASKGDYIVMSQDGEVCVHMTPDQYKSLYGPTASYKLHRYWTELDTVIIRVMMETDQWMQLGTIRKRSKAEHSAVNSRLGFLERREYVRVRRTSGRREFIITEKGKRALKK